MHVHSCQSLVEIPDLHVSPPCLRNSNCKYTPMPSDFLFKALPPNPCPQILKSCLWYGMDIIRNCPRRAREPGLKIISRESPDTTTGQIHFSLVTYRFWPVKFIRFITLKTGAHEPKLALYFSKKVIA